MNSATSATPSEALRAAMVDRVRSAGHASSTAVEQAMRAVPRHRFVPAAAVKDAYADIAVITKSAGDGTALSCASVPTVVAMMLDQLDVRPGDRVLEIGAGTGYNAALLARLTGDAGHVTTVDIDPEVTAQARQALDATGYRHVQVITGDGASGAPQHAPYDRIIFTVGAWDIPPAIWDQLAPGGRLVIPLRWRGQTRSVAFLNDGDRLRSDSVELCGFVPMLGQEGEHTGHLDTDGHVTVFWDTDQPVDRKALHGVLPRDRATAWSDVTVGGSDSFDGVWLRLTATEPGTCRITAQPAAVTAGLCTPAIPSRSPALIQGDSLAYLALRPHTTGGAQRRWELGSISHGPAGPELAHRIVEQIQAWDQDRTALPAVTAYRTGTPTDEVPIRKQDSLLVVSYGAA